MPSEEAAIERGAAEAFAGLPQEEVQRAETYLLLARLFQAPPKAELLVRLSGLQGDDSPFGAAVTDLAAAARASSEAAAEAEFQCLFVGAGEAELLPYASHYLAGKLYGKPLAELRRDLAALGIEREKTAGEPEDHLASLFEFMAAIILGRLTERPLPVAEQSRLFQVHLGAWAPRFFEDLAAAEASVFYAAAARLGLRFLTIERNAAEMAA